MNFETIPIILIISAILCVWGYWSFELWQSHGHWISLAVALLGVVGGVSLAQGQRWSRYLVYLSTVVVVSTWAYQTSQYVGDTWPYETLRLTIISLLPALFLLTVAIGSSYVVFKHFSTAE